MEAQTVVVLGAAGLAVAALVLAPVTALAVCGTISFVLAVFVWAEGPTILQLLTALPLMITGASLVGMAGAIRTLRRELRHNSDMLHWLGTRDRGEPPKR